MVQFNVEKHNVVSTLFNVVNFNDDVHNVVSAMTYTTLFQRWFDVVRRRDVISTQKQRGTDVEMFAGVLPQTNLEPSYKLFGNSYAKYFFTGKEALLYLWQIKRNTKIVHCFIILFPRLELGCLIFLHSFFLFYCQTKTQ